jgi:protocatechuate 3,4-dioxygenase beta subunit
METAMPRPWFPSRRDVVGAALLLPIAAIVRPAMAQVTPACGRPTTAQTEGPFFRPRSPQRVSLLEPGVGGDTLHVAGRVLTRDCRPLAGAVLEFWQADAQGRYDTAGFRLRGHQLADAEGRWDLTTIVPALYPGRTRHIHVKVAAAGRPPLTTQLYFPGDPGNRRDGLYRRELEMAMSGAGEGRFDFVLDLG